MLLIADRLKEIVKKLDGMDTAPRLTHTIARQKTSTILGLYRANRMQSESGPRVSRPVYGPERYVSSPLLGAIG